MTRKTHWLFGRGPDKTLDFAREIDVETDCSKCIHNEVCGHDMEKRCENYQFGTSPNRGCQSCLHRFTRFHSESVPCFSCPWFQASP
jgi:hypothetical protein